MMENKIADTCNANLAVYFGRMILISYYSKIGEEGQTYPCFIKCAVIYIIYI